MLVGWFLGFSIYCDALTVSANLCYHIRDVAIWIDVSCVNEKGESVWLESLFQKLKGDWFEL